MIHRSGTCVRRGGHNLIVEKSLPDQERESEWLERRSVVCSCVRERKKMTERRVGTIGIFNFLAIGGGGWEKGERERERKRWCRWWWCYLKCHFLTRTHRAPHTATQRNLAHLTPLVVRIENNFQIKTRTNYILRLRRECVTHARAPSHQHTHTHTPTGARAHPKMEQFYLQKT